MRVVVWNMAQDHGNWKASGDLGTDIALLCEAPPPPPVNVGSIGHWRTRGLDCPHVDEDGCTCRPWSTAIVSPHQLDRIEDARISRSGRKLAYGPSRPGSWIAGVIKDVPDLGTVTAISLYGLLDEKSDASVHRSLSELAPVFDDERYNALLLLSGDLNTWTGWKTGSHLDRDRVVLEWIRAYDLIDCLERTRTPGRLENCPCSLGEDCTHTRTRVDPRRPEIPYQMDYLYASPALAERLVSCEGA